MPVFDEEIDSATKVGKIKSLVRGANDTAYNDLLLSCSDEVSFGAVDEALTSKLPDGDAAKAYFIRTRQQQIIVCCVICTSC